MNNKAMNNQAFQQLLAEGKIIGVLETDTRHNQLWQKARVNHGEGITTDEWFQVGANGKHVKVGRPVSSSSLSIDWTKVDWNKSSRELEAELDTSYETINKYRKLVGHAKTGTARTRHIDWTTLDWTKNNQQLAGELGCNINSVVQYRHRLGKPSEGYVPRKVSKEMIEAVDWEHTKDITLSHLWGVSRERVRQIRLVENKPRCVITTTIATLQEVERWLLNNKVSIEGKLAHEVAELCPAQTVRDIKFRVMKKVDIQFIWKRKHALLAETFDVNWDIPNNILSWVWDRSDNWAAANRWRQQKPRAKWFHKWAMISHEQFAALPGLVKAVNGELAKARKIGITPKIKELREYGFDV